MRKSLCLMPLSLKSKNSKSDNFKIYKHKKLFSCALSFSGFSFLETHTHTQPKCVHETHKIVLNLGKEKQSKSYSMMMKYAVQLLTAFKKCVGHVFSILMVECI